MTSNVSDNRDGFMYVKCPFRDITGCDYMVIVHGYCTVGKYCVQDCSYAWLPKAESV